LPDARSGWTLAEVVVLVVEERVDAPDEVTVSWDE
jgi:hypothetical protein